MLEHLNSPYVIHLVVLRTDDYPRLKDYYQLDGTWAMSDAGRYGEAPASAFGVGLALPISSSVTRPTASWCYPSIVKVPKYSVDATRMERVRSRYAGNHDTHNTPINVMLKHVIYDQT